MEINKKFLEEFIEIYKENPCLWRVKSKEYSDRNKKGSAYEKLAEKLREIEPTANKESVVKKINNIRSSFRKEMKKVKDSLKSGAGEEDVYKPHLWYYDLLSFLTDQEVAKDSVSNIEENQSQDTWTASPAAQSVEEIQNSNSDTPSSFRSTFTRANKRTHKTSSTESVLAAVSQRLAQSRPEDECDIIGKNVAEKLRQVDKKQKIFAEKIIHDVLFEAQLGNLNRNCKLVIEYDIDNTSHQQPNRGQYASLWSEPNGNATTYFTNFDPNIDS